ncbi:hypothetical protein EMCRGX_G021128 [Ephydatia muelleri]
MAMIDDQIKKIKLKVLEEQRHYLSKRLDPNRYNIFLKTKGILDIFSIQKINAKVTDPEKVDLLIDEMVSHIEGRHGEPPLDLLVEAIYSEGMQNHIARVLLKAFLRECAEEGIGLQYGDSAFQEDPSPPLLDSIDTRQRASSGPSSAPVQAQNS